MSVKVLNRNVVHTLCTDIDSVSIKRIAWAFGCSKKGSEEESELHRMLLAKVERIQAQHGDAA